ncbi:hypothetical protein XELAEV_18017186mg [Xenopus laevis]|uniref:Uncharacterized protein n=1 Tax=Xenopus laevis TaxID=8355 RepID=A0A974DDF6_XENLA|nr:hypothetical protein XELAEV_18017186mg [Xenopus laevis]
MSRLVCSHGSSIFNVLLPHAHGGSSFVLVLACSHGGSSFISLFACAHGSSSFVFVLACTPALFWCWRALMELQLYFTVGAETRPTTNLLFGATSLPELPPAG